MQFRPCIDIHNGRVKQIVGSTLTDKEDFAKENFVSEKNADFYAELYKRDNLKGGHIILLNPVTSEYYEKDCEQARLAFNAYKNAMQIGGGITDKNAERFLKMGASHVIVTSFVFKDGQINYKNLDALVSAVGKENIVLDLSCRKRDGKYYIVTDRWQNFTEVEFSKKSLRELSGYCDEYLIHAVDTEGKANGIEEEVASLLSTFTEIPCTYAGGISAYEDIEKINALSSGRLNFTVGSALDLFGGKLEYEVLAKKYCR